MVRYSNGSYQRAAGTRAAFAGLSAALVAERHPEIQVNSGDREPEDQEREFLKKFVPSSGPKDVGPYNDRRYWAGHGWYKRVVGGGTVAVPRTSNHEARRAADLAYPYNSDTPAHRRAQQLAPRFGITCEGLGFSEWWHWTYWGPLGTIDQPAGGGNTAKPTPPVPEEDDMKAIIKTGAPNSGIIIQAGVPPYSIPEQTFQALCSVYGITPLEVPDWKYDTVVREQWTAFSTAQAFAANRSLSQADIEKIAAATRAALEPTS